ncbi:hypothetical protein [Glutamicibacter halophytocola]|uniref:hypothetical protein n=1 Tax=Glutamicibacter halophytocola TaxID=1933880 RepID=UPI0015C524C8|nr:hypothetical protein [Glutamicibacter halophytocola]NQD39965.1 hypothetical protein [Glutamicibacter halophytocola]
MNIVAKRRYYLDDFGMGWEEAYLIVRVPNSKERREYVQRLKDGEKAMEAELEPLTDTKEIAAVSAKYEEMSQKYILDMAKSLVTGGQVPDTKEDGSVEMATIGLEDVDTVLDAIGSVRANDLIIFAVGANGLKAKN